MPFVTRENARDYRYTPRREKNIGVLLRAMIRLSQDVNDREICNRFQIFLTRTEADITLRQAEELRRNGIIRLDQEIDDKILPFYRHYLYMLKRLSKAG